MTTPTAAIVEEGPPLDALENANHIVGEALQNVEVGEIISAITAAELETQYPLTETMRANIEAGREVVRQNLDHGNNRMMAIIGECGIVDPEITLELMRKLRHEVQPLLTMIDIVGRGNYDKPRTVGGFPGVVHMPNLETDDPNAGVEMVWRLQREIAEIGIPYSTEMLTPNNSPIAEPFLSAGWVGSRSVTDHSQKKTNCRAKHANAHKN